MAGFDRDPHERRLAELSSKVGFAPATPHHTLGAPFSHDRSFRDWLNDYAARPGILTTAFEWCARWLIERHPATGVVLSLLAASTGAGYCWTALFGDGIRGGLSGPALENASSYPNADAAVIAAIALYGSGFLMLLVLMARRHGSFIRHWPAIKCAVVPAFTGLCMFLLSRLFV